MRSLGDRRHSRCIMKLTGSGALDVPVSATMNVLAELIARSHQTERTQMRLPYRTTAQRHVRFLIASFAGALLVAFVTYFAFALHLNLSTSGSLYMLLIVIVAVNAGFWEATIPSLLAVGCLNYFFVDPPFSFAVKDPTNWIALGTFEATTLIVSRLSALVRDKARAEAQHRQSVEKLYELSRRILMLDLRKTVCPQLVNLIREILRPDA